MKPPAFQFYPDSWLSSTDISLMTPAEEGAYIRLLCHAWLQDDCGIPDDDDALAVLSRLGRAWKKSAPKIRAKFDARDGRLFNDRLARERVKQEEHRKAQSDSGKRGAEIRWGGHSDPNRVPIDSPMAKNSSPSSSSFSDNTPSAPDGAGGQIPLIPQGEVVTVTEGTANTLDVQRKNGMRIVGVHVDTETEAEISRVAEAIHERHPAPRRNISVKLIGDKLRTIVKKHPKAERIGVLERINENHAAHCRTRQWTKDGGEFAKGLENWLAPTMGRFLEPPADSAPQAEPDRYMDAREWLRIQDERASARAAGGGGVQ